MTTKQIANIHTVNQKTITDLALMILNAFEVATQLDKVAKEEAKGLSENQINLVNIRASLMKAIETCNQLTPER